MVKGKGVILIVDNSIFRYIGKDRMPELRILRFTWIKLGCKQEGSSFIILSLSKLD